MRADLRLAIETIERLHPDLGHSVDRAAVVQTAGEVATALDRPSGGAGPPLLEPDLRIEGAFRSPRAAIDALLSDLDARTEKSAGPDGAAD